MVILGSASRLDYYVRVVTEEESVGVAWVGFALSSLPLWLRRAESEWRFGPGLCRWTQNGRVFRERIEPFWRECEKRGIELVFLDGPHGANVDEIVAMLKRNAEFLQDNKYNPDSPDVRDAIRKTDPRAWWDYNRERTLALGIGETLDLVRDALEKQRFDGVFGFSQGGALAAITAAVLERPALYPSFLRDGKPIHPPLQFCISVCGFRLIDPVTTRILTPSFKTPIMHILGEKDTIVPVQRSKALVALSENCRVVRHEGAHIVPLTASWTAFYCDFIENPSFDIRAPVVEAGQISLL
ncbi:hypothetical protein NP233_g398 [Leucocoprinus birnbaumii]|uniref:Serine hydrolase domain-containing protein n=1 Tax=Leucocoprinus birnbaumii TaxID=56174 RepID=A0AAD5W5K8_9AGAR|nr:hypothetical protein NP233_g398 [Leucocoprinus birnbaumii]